MEHEKTGDEIIEENIPREDAQEIGEATLAAARKSLLAQAMETGKHFAKDLRTTQLQFAEQLKRSQESGELHIQEKEFTVWEKEASDDWQKIQSAETDAELGAHERAEIEAESIAYPNHECDNTIEAQSGNFYFARIRELITAIEEVGDEKDLALAKGFPDTAAEHLRFKFTPRETLRDEFDTGDPSSTWKRVDEARNRAHNRSIQQLNAINGLAEKYGTTRLTFRNFRTKGYLEDLPPAEDAIAENDRACLEAYYTIAFKSEVARLNAKRQREISYGLYWLFCSFVL